MNVRSLLRSLHGRSSTPALPVPVFIERRRPAYRCAGCNRWGEKLIFMSNGRDYCLPCARDVYGWFGNTPAGRRHDDIKSLDDPLSADLREVHVTTAST
jgi:hypothetical protein